ncbi:unnamed protein product [Rotaria socialis]|uniref:Nucleoside diphosphate kinase n=1 Tax=Rotaria socialis TaxID=392032 RepID=A0A818LAE2_9BILA|nr:unnamed protein product [Rotaria socialis]CAF3163686.1 unnamed protein product [Rotaria socialis]CAF3563243.1 unnamed protein product [Rotaria socialis]CAF3672011.1 unnamed protein product [Rotaria socialis]CAF3704210.1 unnamed protein product [Rotaria socialis]
MTLLILLLISLTTIGNICCEKLNTNVNLNNKQEYCSKKDDGNSQCESQISDQPSSLSSSKLDILNMAGASERTFIMIKPDGVQRGVVGDIIRRFEQRGYKLVALKMLQPPKALLESHYEEHKGKKFYEPLLEYIGSGPVVATVWEGVNVITVGRKMLGATDPAKSEPGTIRGDFGIVTGRNIVHGSDSESAAKREIGLWFRPEEVSDWKHTAEKWIYE